MLEWNKVTKRLLKSELVKKGISHSELAVLLQNIGIEETKSSIDSKISRGTFSASFLLQCLFVIGSDKIEISGYGIDKYHLSIAAESDEKYDFKNIDNV